jgi:hypothetical protein
MSTLNASPDHGQRICWFCESRVAEGNELIEFHRISGVRDSFLEGKRYTYYKNAAVAIPRCEKCRQEKELLAQLRPKARQEIKARNPRSKKYLLFLLGIPLGVLACILIVELYKPGPIAALPLLLCVLCLIPMVVIGETYDNRINKLFKSYMEEYKASHGILYKEKDPKTHPEVMALIKAGWSYGHSPGAPVSWRDLPLPKR